MNRSRLILRRARWERLQITDRMKGSHWGDERAVGKSTPLNLLGIYQRVIGRPLIANNPRIHLSTFDKRFKPAIDTAQSWANSEIKRMKLHKTLQRVVTDALISVGIAKVCIATPADAAMIGWNRRAGEAGIWRVDLDDWVFDTHARDLEEVSYEGHRFRVPLEAIKDSKLYNRAARKRLAPAEDRPFNLEGDERISTLGRGMYLGEYEEYEDMVDLWEIYLPRKRLVLTLLDDDLTGATYEKDAHQNIEALKEQDWIGPDSGPYHHCYYEIVPGNPLPKGPMQDEVDKHDAINRAYRKLIDGCDNAKQLVFATGGAIEDAKRIQTASNLEMIRVDQPDKLSTHEFGGPNQPLFLFAQHLWDTFSKSAGNIDMAGGLAPQSKTLGQDELLAKSASAQISSMQQDTVDFTAKVVESLLWYWWNNPRKTMRVKHHLAGAPEFEITRQLTPDMRQRLAVGDIEVQCDPYSLQHQTPQQMLEFLDETIQAVSPMLPLFQQQGVVMNADYYLKKRGEYGNSPDLTELFSTQEPIQAESPGGDKPPSMPQNTKREYVRRSLGGNSQQSQGADLRNQLMAAGKQNGQQSTER